MQPKIHLKESYKFILLLIILHAIYLIYALIYKKIYNADSYEYLQLAYNIRNFGYFYCGDLTRQIDPFFISLRPPGYSFLILIIKLFFKSDFAILIIQNVLSIVVFYYLFKLFEKYTFRFKSWYFILITLLLFPATMRLVNSVLSDQLFQFFIFFSFYSILQYLETRKIKYLVFYNLFLVTALFVKPAILYFWIVNVVFSFVLYTREKKSVILYLSIVMPLLITFWCYRNEKLTGYYHFSSISSQDIVECYAYNALLAKYGSEYADSVRSEIINKSKLIKNFPERCKYLNKEGSNIIRRNILIYAYVHARGMLSFMLDPGRLEIVSFFPIKPEKEISFFREIDEKGLFKGIWYYVNHIPVLLISYLAIIFFWNLILLISFIYFIFNKQNNILLRTAVFMMVGYFCSISVITGYARFKNAVLPILIFTLPFLIEAIYVKFVIREKSRSN